VARKALIFKSVSTPFSIRESSARRTAATIRQGFGQPENRPVPSMLDGFLVLRKVFVVEAAFSAKVAGLAS
jgi:hypothetical protein